MPFEVGITILVVIMAIILYAIGYCMGRADEARLHETQEES